MYENLIETLRYCAKHNDCHDCPHDKYCKGAMGNDGYFCEAANAIEKLNKRINVLMNYIFIAEDALDHGADNEWARAALEKAMEKGMKDEN